jgi:hypothetical protein
LNSEVIAKSVHNSVSTIASQNVMVLTATTSTPNTNAHTHLKSSSSTTVSSFLRQQFLSSLLLSTPTIRTTSTDMCTISYTVTIPSTSAVGYTNAAQAYNETVSALTTAVTTGSFSTSISNNAQSLNAVNMINVITNGEPTFTSYNASLYFTDDTYDQGKNSNTNNVFIL